MTAKDVRRIAGLVAATAALASAPAFAQRARPARIALETVVSADHLLQEETPRADGLAVDLFVSVRLTDRLQFVAQPLLRRLPNGTWIHDTYQLALRFESAGAIPLRVEVGQIPSPVGQAALRFRANLSPTLAYPAALYLPLPRFEQGAPRVEMITPGYPVGAQLTMGGRRWDARGGVIDSAPVRYRRGLFEDSRPHAPQVVAGAGFQPVAGMRVGGSVARGRYASAKEITAGRAFDRHVTVTDLEWEYAFGHTRLTAEWLQNRLDADGPPAVARWWLAEWVQTLAPRWFVASRVERLTAPRLIGRGREVVTLGATDTSLSYRVSRDLTVRAGHVARRGFGVADWDHQAGVCIVWARRWW